MWRFRRLSYTLQRLRGSIALRGWRGTIARVRQEFEQRPEVDDSLHIEPWNIPFEPFEVPCSASPLVSVVIPVFGKVKYTLACLRSIMRHPPGVPFEIIVADDASDDGSIDLLENIGGLRLIKLQTNVGFIGTCNAGAAAARGRYLLFLNNDTQVTNGWMDALLACFAQRPRCGLAGSRLVYPDGRLQMAGGLVFADGSCWNLGRFENRDAPPWRRQRQVDYLSGASLMIPKQLFDALGGFNSLYAPAYYEDVDLAFAVRDAGFETWYEPASTVIHFEGISAGTDLDSGMKRFQVTNQAKFVATWATALQKQPSPGTPISDAIARSRRGNILIVDSMTPDPTRDSGSVRLTEMMRLLDAQGWDVTFMPDDGRASSHDAARLGALGVQVIGKPWTQSIPSWLHEHGARLDAVILSRHTVAGQYIDLVRKHAPKARVIFDTVDLHFLREQRAAEVSGNHAMARQAEASRRSELSLIARCDVTFVVSAHELDMLTTMLPEACVELLSNIHEASNTAVQRAHRHDLVFIGGYAHPPNADAIRWLAEAIAPLLRERFPQLSIHVLGEVPDDARNALQVPGLQFHGRVPDLTPWLADCLASVAPLRFGAGVKGKINMAMSHGVPVIATSLAVEGMQLEHGSNVWIADHATGFVEAVEQLLSNEVLWSKLSEGGIENIRQHFSPEAAANTLRRVLE